MFNVGFANSVRAAIVAGLMFLGAQEARAEVRYILTELGTLGGPESYATDINNSGQITGWASTPGNEAHHAFLYSNGTMKDLGALNEVHSMGWAINERGQVVGDAYTSGELGFRAFSYSDGMTSDLGSLGGRYSGARDINDQGVIVGGSSTTGDAVEHAFVYSGGQMQDLGSPGIESSAYTINNLGQIGGLAGINGRRWAVLFEAGTVKGLWSNNSNDAYVADINDSGIITGDAVGAVLYANGQQTPLWPGFASAINERGEVVGYAYDTSSQTFQALLWEDDHSANLNDLIDPALGWHLSEALGINDLGQIVGRGSKGDGLSAAFLLTPIPEPAAVALVALGVVMFLRQRAR
jgi:probable HAF family extracellular repeat protein